MTPISRALLADFAQKRRRGGLWYVTFVVEGYDEDYTFALPGNLKEGFAVGYAQYKCWKMLHRAGDRRLKVQHVIHKETRYEGT